MFLFLFFLFHNLDLALGLPLFSSWLKNPINLVIFVPLKISFKFFFSMNVETLEVSHEKKLLAHLKTPQILLCAKHQMP
jgi:1-acyl-sn-glycerol-3-phosphate acyltransferase